MKLSLTIKDRRTNKIVTNYDEVMEDSGMNTGLGFEDIGIQSDGTPVIFDKCGNYSYIASDYELIIMSDR